MCAAFCSEPFRAGCAWLRSQPIGWNIQAALATALRQLSKTIEFRKLCQPPALCGQTHTAHSFRCIGGRGLDTRRCASQMQHSNLKRIRNTQTECPEPGLCSLLNYSGLGLAVDRNQRLSGISLANAWTVSVTQAEPLPAHSPDSSNNTHVVSCCQPACLLFSRTDSVRLL